MSVVHPRFVFGCLLMAVVVVLSGPTARTQAQPGAAHSPRKAVLVLYATRRAGVVPTVSDPVLRRVIGDGLGGSLDYYSETLDVLLVHDPAYRDALEQFLHAKYQGQTFDLFVAVGDASLEFLNRFRSTASAHSTPLVFAVQQPTKAPANSTGIIVPPHFGASLESVLALHPDTELVTVISGASPVDRGYEAEARAEFAALKPRVKINYLSGLPITDVIRQVARMPPHSVLFLTTFAEDAEGQIFPTLEITDRVSRAANAPLYSWVNVHVGHGVVGGRMASQEVLVTRTADLALRLLKGERPETIPVAEVDWTTSQFDWAQLRRWGISESRLPPGSQVLFRPQSTWEQYRGYLIGGGAVLLLQAGFIIALLLQRVGRRRAVIALRESEARFRLLADTAPVLIWLGGTDKGCDFVNRPWLEFTGRTLEQELGQGWIAGVHPEDLPAVMETYGAAFAARRAFRMEYRQRRADGEYRWLMDAGVPRYEEGNRFAGYVGSCVDVTDYRQAMEAFSESQRQQEQLAGKLIDAQERERTRLARELHDDINQQLAGLAISLSGIKRRSDARESPGLAADLRFLQERTAAVVENIRHISHGLHPAMLEHAGLVAALSSHCQELERNTQLPFKFAAEGDCDDLSPAARLCMFRVAQEALRNVVTHARPSRVTVRLRCNAGSAEISVADDGQGFDERVVRRHAAGLGLVSIQERARLAGGTMTVVTEIGKGTEVIVRIPVDSATHSLL